jgi:hypothetical protein
MSSLGRGSQLERRLETFDLLCAGSDQSQRGHAGGRARQETLGMHFSPREVVSLRADAD